MQVRDDSIIIHGQIQDMRGYKVVKHNDLVQKARFQLTLQEQKILLFMISKLTHETVDFEHHSFNIVEFCKVCGIDYGNGKNYKNVKETIKVLADKSVWLRLNKETETLVRWISKATINKRSGTIKLQLDNDMKPFLLDLSEKFTSYELLYTLAMRSQYSIRLYELFKSYEWRKRCKFSIADLKRMLFAEHYTRFPDFKRNVLEIAMLEINELTDIAVKYEIIKEGRKYSGIEFLIRTKKDAHERIAAWNRIDRILNPQKAGALFKLPAKL